MMLLVWKDPNCSGLQKKTFKDSVSINTFLESEDFCPGGERVDYFIITGYTQVANGSVDRT